jgi:hypothetical protein
MADVVASKNVMNNCMYTGRSIVASKGQYFEGSYTYGLLIAVGFICPLSQNSLKL